VKIGVTLPTFTSDASEALRMSRSADEVGIDGVFVFDHLWPGHDKSQPALSMYPVLGAVAASISDIRIGSLVARVGLLPDEQVIQSFLSLREMAGDRLVASLGIGDHESVPENAAYGVAWPELEERRASLMTILDTLVSKGIECWVGATSSRTVELARGAGVSVNLWNVSPDRLAAEAGCGSTTWAGPLPASSAGAAEKLGCLQQAGAEWVIWAWPRSLELVASAIRTSGLSGTA
jgi:alkanesulfonate monooxygenase SsuD/methylene tetrahydromethanopterin reductase-like flavin-dependent oxidoreductase (luciferase family)